VDDKLIDLIRNSFENAETALYVYFALDYGSSWIFLGLCIWGIRTVWNHIKKNL